MAFTPTVLTQQFGVAAYWWPTLYGEAVGGQARYWMIGFTGTHLCTFSGQVGNEQPLPHYKLVKPCAGRTLAQQVLLDVNSQLMKRERKERFFARDEEGKQISMAQMTEDSLLEPHPDFMLAEDYVIGSHNFATQGELWAEWKLDGNRIAAFLSQGQILYRTRGSKLVRSITHLDAAIQAILAQLPAGAELDGEVYRHGWSMNKINSVLKRHKHGLHPEAQLLEFHVFDVMLPAPYQHMLFRERQTELQRIIGGCQTAPAVQFVPYVVVQSEQEMWNLHKYYAQDLGYEGLILRVPNAPYMNKRCWAVMKYKVFMDEEMQIINVIAAEGDHADQALLVVRDRFGHEMVIQPSGPAEMKRYWLQNPQSIIGRADYVVRHFGRSEEYGVPRFPTGKCFRNNF